LRLLQLASPALPIGAYAYSHGLEQAVTRGSVSDETSLASWVCGVMSEGLGTLDVPVLCRTFAAFCDGDVPRARYWMRFGTACRDSRELCDEERHMGQALARVLDNLGVEAASQWINDDDATYGAMLALAALHFDIPLEAAAGALLFGFAENQVGCGARLLPLGQLAAQRVLSRALERIPASVSRGILLEDAQIATSTPGLSIASCLHETQYCRLFRS
jgi:urease accessory protein